jgi:type I restriction enzyme S subunit
MNENKPLPKGWEVKNLGDIGKIFNGNSINATIKKEKYLNINGGMPYIATKDISYENIIDYSNGISIPFEEKSNFRFVPKNTTLICAEGGSAGRKIGFTSQEVCFGNKLFALIVKNGISNKYIYYYYFSDNFQKDFQGQMTGIIGGVSMAKFKKLNIPLPSLPEQKCIVAILDKTFAEITKAEAIAKTNLQNAKELFESYLNNVFKDKGDDWEEKKLNDICTKITDGVHQKPNYISKGVPFLKINNLTKGDGISFDKVSYISKEDHELYCKRTRPEKGDILITKDGTIGIVRIIDTDIEFSIFVSLALIKPINRKISLFLKYILISPLIQKQIKPKGAALKHLYLKDLRNFSIPIPPIQEQQKIIHKLNYLQIQ